MQVVATGGAHLGRSGLTTTQAAGSVRGRCITTPPPPPGSSARQKGAQRRPDEASDSGAHLQQGHLVSRLREVLTGIGVRGLMDQVACLLGLGLPEALGDALLGCHG
jgi:hypothetical protein